MPKHSPEPWSTSGGVIRASNGVRIPELYADGMEEIDAERTVACVNFCKCVPQSVLEEFSKVDQPILALVEASKSLLLAQQLIELSHGPIEDLKAAGFRGLEDWWPPEEKENDA